MQKLPLISCLALALAAGACTSDDNPGVITEASLRVVNDSDFAIDQIYLTDVGSRDWGPNLLRGDVLLPGEDILLGVNCGTFDALIVDTDGVDCEVDDIDLCLNDATWVIRNNTCTVFGAKGSAN